MNTRENGIFLVLCGIDGSGKSSVLAQLITRFHSISTTHWKDLRALEKDQSTCGLLLGKDPSKHIHSLSPMQRALFVASIAWGEYEQLILPRLSSKSAVVISDSYFYKFWAKEKCFGEAHPALYDLLARLPKPDHIIFLDVDVQRACERKPVFTPYETDSADMDGHIRFQTRVLRYMREAVGFDNVTVVDANRSPTDVLDRVASIVQTVCGEQFSQIPKTTPSNHGSARE